MDMVLAWIWTQMCSVSLAGDSTPVALCAYLGYNCSTHPARVGQEAFVFSKIWRDGAQVDAFGLVIVAKLGDA